MFTFLLILIMILPIAALPMALDTVFAPSELVEMGIVREDTGSQNVLSEADSAYVGAGACI